ncbi:hypothetical protein QEZ54_19220 [Catellatospora sp. KI3]|uniref:hypothetical protein n=1 Tax=Catellatospora sp. KI3 TaxID=3041620 RepID=UPI00248260C7|nr:hypothetical protein [Catellatospora sp. KI3]MDI1463113.1 hypothetical protein [Catellatospora sp. KI3]
MTAWQYVVLAGLGAFHGLNPGMGWLLAVAAGLRERNRVAALRVLLPVAVGHALSVFAVATLVGLAVSVGGAQQAAVVGGVLLLGFGLWQLRAGGHLHWRGLRPTGRHLLGWSFLMSSVHGAGLVLLPVLVAVPVAAPAGHHHAGAAAGQVSALTGLAATAVHTAAMVAVSAVIALAVLRVLAVRALRVSSWLDLDRVWAVALIGSGAITIALVLLGH